MPRCLRCILPCPVAGILLGLVLIGWHASHGLAAEPRPTTWIGYTESRNDLPDGQYANAVTSRACLVRSNGTERREVAPQLVAKENSWTQFAGWSPDGRQAVVLSLWESPENARWEREHRTFRMTEGWLVDSCLVDLSSGAVQNLTAVDRVSIYNTGLFFLPGDQGFGFTPLIDGISKPYVMDRHGGHKRDVSGDGDGFAYGYSASPDGTHIAYHEDYQIYVSRADGSGKQRIETGNPFNFAPQWSPDGQWLLFVSGQHYDCHPHVVKRDGTGLRKLADRGGYRGVVERLKHPDFHSESSDVPVWARDGHAVYFTAQVGEAIELMRVTLEGEVTQLTQSTAGVRHYHPSPSPDGQWLLFGSDRSGVMQIYVSRSDGTEPAAVTSVPVGSCAMHGHWQPVAAGQEIPEGPFSFEQRPDRLLIALRGKPIAEYAYADPKILRPYFAQVRTAGGIQVTRTHPPVEGVDATDHATMHPGIWLGFGRINGEDFWRNKGRLEHVRFVDRPSIVQGKLTFATESRLLNADGGVLGEVVNRYELQPRPAGWRLSWEATFLSRTGELVFGDQEEMGLGVRVATGLTEKNGGVITSSTGRRTAEQTWGQPASWCDYSGTIDDRPAGITILPAAGNFRESWWHNRDYGVFVANPFGRAAMKQGEVSEMVVPRGEPFRIKFSVVVHEGTEYDPDAEWRAVVSEDRGGR
ncbi:MAG: DUF6807 family protein [Pirellulales bacterium]